ncbi:FAD-binding oxidoreductase [Blastococcus sp. SYSU DS0669]
MSLTELPREPEQPVALLDADAVNALVPPFPAADVDVLRGLVHGPVYAAGDDGLAAEVATWNVAIQHTPSIAVGATCAADVAAAVSWAVARGLRVAVQATGHGPVRNAAGSMMITTRRMQGLFIDPERRTVRVEAGVKWKRLMESAAEFGLAGLCGSSSDVGVIGYTLGGGVGSLGRKHGFAADHVRAVEIVTADGRQRTLSPDSEPELFWAVRGGKGNFGVVTALEMDLVPLTGLYAGGVFFAGEDMAAVLHAFGRWSRELPEEVGTSVAILRLPDMEFLPPPLRGQTAVHLRYAYCGTDFDEGQRLVEPMMRAGRILLGFIGPMRTDEMDSIHMDPVDPVPAWEKGQLLTELTDDGIDALLAVAGPQAEIPLMMVELRKLGGAFARAPKVPNAVAGRDGGFSMLALGPGVPELAEIVPAVGRGVLGAMAPWRAPGCLTNFLGDVSGPGEVAAAYPPGVYQRLAEVKAAVDPERVFSFGHAF